MRAVLVLCLFLTAACEPPPLSAPPPVAPARPSPAPSAARVSDDPLPTACGLVEGRLDELVTGHGAGVAHPERLRLEAALSRCRVDVLAEHAWCVDRLAMQTEMQRSYGEQHPLMKAARRHVALCRRWFGPRLRIGAETERCAEAKRRNEAPAACDVSVDAAEAAPSRDECRRWASERDDLRATGKGERHPAVLAAEAKLSLCR